MRTRLGRAASATAKVALMGIVGLAAGTAEATEGYFQHGFGARQQALGGAGVADSRDAMSLSLNPAGLVDVGHQFQGGASLFMPYRGYTGTGTGMIARGTIDSDSNYFVVPNMAYSRPIDAESAIGVALFGNGGMNTTYANVPNAACAGFGLPNQGVFCGGRAGVDLMQAFLTVGYARKFGAVSFGVAPVLAIQRFKAEGLSAFGAFGFSSDAAHLTNNGYDWSYGGGVRAGLQWAVAPNFRIGLSGQTKMWMTKFDKYRGLFADQGNFDIPANVTAGIAWDVMPSVTLMLDYKRIFYSGVGAVSNSSLVTPGSLGSSGGPGFGWRDVDAFKFGAEWRATPDWTWRVGYSHNNNPIRSADVTLNILAPGVMTDHFTGGFSRKVSKNSTIEFAAMYAPKHSVSGLEVVGAAPTPGSNIELSMHQYQLTLGWTYQFDSAPIVRKY